ncbi:nucleotide pyrophosphohydrolase [Candidatus Woesearchaeota archaeon]|nr:nucleotide pyrophosphohydrolase [Candidatus Woesearchaeota archaeon]
MDDKTSIQQLKDKIKKYCDERDWDQFHNAKELSTALILEAAEILEPFRFKSEKEVEEFLNNSRNKEEVSEEMADVLYFLLRLSQRYDIDISEAFHRKMKKNEKRYPVEKAKGSNKKYNEL